MPSQDAPNCGEPRVALVRASSLDEARADAATLLKVPANELVLTVINHQRTGFLGLGGDEYKVEARWTPPLSSSESDTVRETDTTSARSGMDPGASGAVPVTLSCKRGRISLAVTRPAPGQRAALRSDVDRMLAGLPLSALDTDVIDALLRDPNGVARIVATVSVDKGAVTNPESDPVAVVIPQDHMHAWLVPWEGGPISAGWVVDALVHAGVTAGLDEASLASIGDTAPEMPILVASGVAPVHGTDATVTFAVARDQLAGLRPHDDDQQVDHREVKAFGVPAKVGDVVGTKVPVVPAVDGLTVLGAPIPGSLGKDLDLHKLAGKGVRVSDDGLTIVATATGSASWVADRLCVAPLTAVAGDVDFSTGNVRVEGDLTISGTVSTGFIVEASGNIAVLGAVEGATVVAGGNVIVGGGIIGQEIGTVDAEGSITARFVEAATVRAGGDVVIASEVRLSTILADGSVTVGGGRGAGRITGGLTRGRTGVEAVEIGAENGTPTKIQAGWGRSLDAEDQAPVVAPRVAARSGAHTGTTITVAGATTRITSPTPGGHWRDVDGKLVFTTSSR
jgi:hypothetical protein